MSPTKSIKKAMHNNQPSQKILSVLDGLERQYITLAGAGQGIDSIAYTMHMPTEEILKIRASAASKILIALKPFN